MVARLMEHAGSTRVVDVELTRTEARLTIITGQGVVTYGYRDQQIEPVDSDIAYVGQAIFDPRTFDLDDLGDLFAQAGEAAGSAQNQQLQICDYDSGHIYMTVTTNPDTVPVFFSPDGHRIDPFDPGDPAQLAPALAQVIGTATAVVDLGVDSANGVYADLAAGPGQILHVVRNSRYPVRDQLKPQAAQPDAFDPLPITADQLCAILNRAASHLGKTPADGVSLVVQRQPGQTDPTVTVTIGGKTARLSLTAVVLAG
jgi:hypothetical protein